MQRSHDTFSSGTFSLNWCLEMALLLPFLCIIGFANHGEPCEVVTCLCARASVQACVRVCVCAWTCVWVRACVSVCVSQNKIHFSFPNYVLLKFLWKVFSRGRIIEKSGRCQRILIHAQKRWQDQICCMGALILLWCWSGLAVFLLFLFLCKVITLWNGF